MFSLAIAVEREKYSLEHLGKNHSFLWLPVDALGWEGDLFGSVMQGLAFILEFRIWFFPSGFSDRDAIWGNFNTFAYGSL